MFEMNKLNSLLQKSLNVYTDLSDLNPPKGFWLNVVNAYLSATASYFRYRIKIGTFQSTPINYYCLSLLPSGAFKDATVQFVANNFFGGIKELQSQHLELFIDKYNMALENRLFSEIGKKSKEFHDRYKAEYVPSNIELYLSSGTLEGFCTRIVDINKLPFGCSIHSHGEFIDYFLSQRSDNREILSLSKDLFGGHLRVNTLKSDKRLKSINNVSHNMLLYSSANRLSEKGAMERFRSELETGLLRRCHFSIPIQEDEKELETLTIEERKERNYLVSQACSSISNELTKKFSNGFNHNYGNLEYEKDVRLSAAAEELFNDYVNKINQMCSATPNMTGIINTNKEKVLKLAAVYHLYNNDFINETNISAKSLEEAIHFVDASYEYTEEFLDMRVSNRTADKLYVYLTNKGSIAEGDITSFEWGKNYFNNKDAIKAEMQPLLLPEEEITFEGSRICMTFGNTKEHARPLVGCYDEKTGIVAELTKDTEGRISNFLRRGMLCGADIHEVSNIIMFSIPSIVSSVDISNLFSSVNHIIITGRVNHFVGLVMDSKTRITPKMHSNAIAQLKEIYPFIEEYDGTLINLNGKEIQVYNAVRAFSINYLKRKNASIDIARQLLTTTTITILDEIKMVFEQETIIPEIFKTIDIKYTIGKKEAKHG